ncbi:glycoside hydrolase family 66 protein [Streptococcus dentapri]
MFSLNGSRVSADAAVPSQSVEENFTNVTVDAAETSTTQNDIEPMQETDTTSPAVENSAVAANTQTQEVSTSSETTVEVQPSVEQTSVAASNSMSQEVAGEGDSISSQNGESNNAPRLTRATGAQVVRTRSIVSAKSGEAITDVASDKASYRPNEDVNLNVGFTNTTAVAQDITVSVDVYYLNNKIGNYKFTKTLAAGEGYTSQYGELKIPASQFTNDHGYLLNIKVLDSHNNALGEMNRAIAYESDWTKFPRYGIVGGSQDSHNSLLNKDIENYTNAIEKMKNMNINSYFFYDVYKSATDPFPSDEESFDQTWNWWSNSKIDTQAVKDIVNKVHEGGAVAMLYNMILAENANENAVLPETEYAYNSDSRGYGDQSGVMSYLIDGKPLQRYYNPKSTEWQNKIAQIMGDAMKAGGFDGWQGDTIGDNEVYSYDDRYSSDSNKKFWLSDAYGEFLNAIKEKLPEYYLTVNDINGENIRKLGSSKQDVIYNEIWPFGSSALGNGRQQTEYGDLKARIDEVRKATGKSLIVGAYMEEPKYTDNNEPANGAALDAKNGGEFQKDAVLLTTASIAAAGGYHMSLAALSNSKDADGIGILETAYYPTQSLKVSSELNRKNNDYQQFITAYENILRDGVENDDASVETYNSANDKLSHDASGINGHQVWTYGKKGKDFRTVQLINLMGINSDWKNVDGMSANKTPDEQKNLTVRYNLGNVSREEAERMANQTYVTSPDDWSKSTMTKVSAKIEGSEGNFTLAVDVPQLTLWDVIYISSAEQSAVVEPKVEPEVQTEPTAPAEVTDPQVTEEPSEVTSGNDEPVAPAPEEQPQTEVQPEEPSEPTVPVEPTTPEVSEDTPEIPEATKPVDETPENSSEDVDQAAQSDEQSSGDTDSSGLPDDTPDPSAEGDNQSAQPSQPNSDETPEGGSDTTPDQPSGGDTISPEGETPSAEPTTPEVSEVTPETPEATKPIEETPENSSEDVDGTNGVETPAAQSEGEDPADDQSAPQGMAEGTPSGGSDIDLDDPAAVEPSVSQPAGDASPSAVEEPAVQPDLQAIPADQESNQSGASGQPELQEQSQVDRDEAISLATDPTDLVGNVDNQQLPAILKMSGVRDISVDRKSSADRQPSSNSAEQLPKTGDHIIDAIMLIGLVFISLTGLLVKCERN